MQGIVEFVFFQICIIDVVCQVLLKTFLEKFYFLYCLVSCLGVFHNELLFISDSSCKHVLSLSCGFIFPPVFPVFFRSCTGMYEFSSLVE